MGEERLPSPSGYGSEQTASPGGAGDRVNPRRIFREMVKGEIEDRPLGLRQRRSLVRFGRRLGIDSFEARLIVRAVEYECGHVPPAAMEDAETPVQAEYVIQEEPRTDSFRFAMLLLACVLLVLVLIGLSPS